MPNLNSFSKSNSTKETGKSIESVSIFVGYLLFLTLVFSIGMFAQAFSKNNENLQTNHLLNSKKILVAYFSHSGNTREIANQIHHQVGGDVFEIKTVNPYPTDYQSVVKQAKLELNSGFKPVLKTHVNNLKSYDIVFLVYPNWWGTIPRPVFTFLSELNFSGKTIVPFCTHEGSALGQSVSDIRSLCPKSKILDGLAVRGSSVKYAQNDVTKWLNNIGMLK